MSLPSSSRWYLEHHFTTALRICSPGAVLVVAGAALNAERNGTPPSRTGPRAGRDVPLAPTGDPRTGLERGRQDPHHWPRSSPISPLSSDGTSPGPIATSGLRRAAHTIESHGDANQGTNGKPRRAS